MTVYHGLKRAAGMLIASEEDEETAAEHLRIARGDLYEDSVKEPGATEKALFE